MMTFTMSTDQPHNRKIRSFVIREGRMTPAQQRALDQGWSQYGLQLADGKVDYQQVFGNSNPVIVEIGFGMGQSLYDMAEANPAKNYIGIEVHRPGVGALLKLLLNKPLTNIRIYNDDAVEVLARCLPDNALQGVQLYFPDPWPKKRHHKRRIVQPDFIKRIHAKLAVGGYLHMATDWENYAEHMMEVMSQAPGFTNAYGAGRFADDRPNQRPLTKFEQRGERLGHGVWDLVFVRL